MSNSLDSVIAQVGNTVANSNYGTDAQHEERNTPRPGRRRLDLIPPFIQIVRCFILAGRCSLLIDDLGSHDLYDMYRCDENCGRHTEAIRGIPHHRCPPIVSRISSVLWPCSVRVYGRGFTAEFRIWFCNNPVIPGVRLRVRRVYNSCSCIHWIKYLTDNKHLCCRWNCHCFL